VAQLEEEIMVFPISDFHMNNKNFSDDDDVKKNENVA